MIVLFSIFKEKINSFQSSVPSDVNQQLKLSHLIKFYLFKKINSTEIWIQHSENSCYCIKLNTY